MKRALLLFVLLAIARPVSAGSDAATQQPTLRELVLEVMVELQPPGQSLYSMVVVAREDPPACDDGASLLCAAPQWSWRLDGWVRPETPKEGLLRYEVIAQVIADIASSVDAGAIDAPSWIPGLGFELAMFLIVVSYHEGGWRLDVQRGDNHGGSPTIHEDKGRSWCHVQRWVGRDGRKRITAPVDRGWRALDLIGVDAEATSRCYVTGADVLGWARGWCARRKRYASACTFARYGGEKCSETNPAVLDRVKTFRRVRDLMTREPF